MGIRILQLTEYGFTLEVERDEGEGCLKLVEKCRNQMEFQIQAKYGLSSESGPTWVPLKQNEF